MGVVVCTSLSLSLRGELACFQQAKAVGAYLGSAVEFRTALDLYENPYSEAERTLSFGVGASGSGVPFHIHDDGWCEVLWGKKLWALAPLNLPPQFQFANESSLAWTRDRFPRLGFAERDALQTCVIGPGEALYFPSMWWHMTLNVGETVSVSAFNHGGRDPPLLRGAAPRGGGGEWGKEF